MSIFNRELFGPLASRLSRLPRKLKRSLMLFADVVMVPLVLYCAIALHYGQLNSELAKQWWLYPLAILVVVPSLMRFGLYRAVVRFMGTRLVVTVSNAVLLSVLVLGVVTRFLTPMQVPLSVLIIFALLCFLGIGGSRFAVRSFLQRQRILGERVAIYGAGDAGASLALSLLSGQKYAPVAFIEDSIALHGSVINGIEVFSPDQILELSETLGVSRVLLAVPTASRRRRRKILERLEALPVHVQTMPNLADIVAGITQVDDICEVDVADLLGRDAVPPVESLLDSCIRGKTVMVTGAGGSIGSELCRQIVRQLPERLLLLENSELALYNINKELSELVGKDNVLCEIVPLLGSAQNKRRLVEVMSTFSVQTVYHAAAYKHVPMVEQNIVDGIINNVFGTLNCAEAAIDAKVETFVLISTDKAVCPTNVMGATKRLAEMVLQGLDERGSDTRFCMVRFGNVLASSGSVVPLFREQIQRGGPVTVTHPEIIRYFMTIPEAAQLVIQAGSMGRGGDVFLLDMGKPVRIEDLARRMIHLTGMTVLDDENPDGDIEIKYTGLRPAEKLYEDLLIGTGVMGTEHPMIMRAEEKCLPWQNIREILDRLNRAVGNSDTVAALEILKAAVEEYSASKHLVDLVWVERREHAEKVARAAKITPILTKRKG